MKAKQIFFSVMMAMGLLLVPLAFAGAAVINPPSYGGYQGGVGGGLGDLKSANPNIPTPIQTTGTRQDIILAIAKIIDWALYLAGAIAVLFVIIGGYYYITSRGNEGQSKSGLTTVKNALIGLIIVILAYVAVNVVAGFFQG